MDFRVLILFNLFIVVHVHQVEGVSWLTGSQNRYPISPEVDIRTEKKSQTLQVSAKAYLSRATGRQLVLDPNRICRKMKRLHKNQTRICRHEQMIVAGIKHGADQGMLECQHQFRGRRWNCTRERRSLKKVLMRDTRETAFVDAITAAGVTYVVAQGCSNGSFPSCTCKRSKSSPSPTDEVYKWQGCDDNVEYGYQKSIEFMEDRTRKRSDIKTLLLRHNHEAGRLAVKNHMRSVCKCHGMSGSCTLTSCWRRLPEFRKVGDRLKEKFDGATKVMAGNDGESFIPEGATIKPPEAEDIVYSEDSPNYCEPDRRTGSLGTHGRECNHTSPDVDGCEQLCCERGYQIMKTSETTSCRCRLKWCCEVKCHNCTELRITSRCL